MKLEAEDASIKGRMGSAPVSVDLRTGSRLLGFLAASLLMPEWYVVIATLAPLSALGLFWKPLLLALPMFGYAVGVLLVQAGLSTRHAFPFASAPRNPTTSVVTVMGARRLYCI